MIITVTVKTAFKKVQQQAQLLIQAAFSASNISWKSAELEFFFSDMSIAWERQDIMNKKNKTYYQSVHVFMNRIRIVAVIKNTTRVHQNLDICFWKETEYWWIIKLNDIIHADFMINSNDIAEWCKALKKKFKISFSQTLQNLINTHYTIADIQVCKSSTAYIIFIISAVKQCEQADTEFLQILHIWINFDLVLWEIINKFIKKITISEFMNFF